MSPTTGVARDLSYPMKMQYADVYVGFRLNIWLRHRFESIKIEWNKTREWNQLNSIQLYRIVQLSWMNCKFASNDKYTSRIGVMNFLETCELNKKKNRSYRIEIESNLIESNQNESNQIECVYSTLNKRCCWSTRQDRKVSREN